MTWPDRVRRGRGEEGAYLVLYALLGVAFFTMAAVVLDIAALRQGRRADRTTADLAVTAGVVELDANDPASFSGACEAAWGYVLANRTEAEADGTIAAPDCVGTFPQALPCDASTPRVASGSVGPISIEITHPVPNSSPLMLAEAQSGDVAQSIEPATDGGSCERLGVRVVRSRTFLFGQIAGVLGGSTDVHSVARPLTTTSSTEVAAVVSLDRTGCDGIATTANGNLVVQGLGQSGLAVVDSDASSCPAGFTIDAFDGGGAQIAALPNGPAPGVIKSFALAGTNFARAYDPADTGGGRLTPTPSPAPVRTGRSVIDTRYNCAVGCAAGLDYVDQLEAANGGPLPPAAHNPAPDPSCLVPAGMTWSIVGDTFVDCPVFEVLGEVTFDAASVVFAGDVIVRQNGCLAINDTSCGAAGVPFRDGVLFVRGGLSKEVNAELYMPQTFIWAGGAIDIPLDPNPGGTSALRWSGPLLGRFEDLLLWAESPLPMQLSDQEFLTLQGTVFTPNTAALTMEGRGSMSEPLQVITSRLRIVGSGDVVLRPTAARATGSLTRQVRLIR